MCKNSAKVKITMDAVVDVSYRVMNAADAPSGHGRQPVIAVLAPIEYSFGKDGALSCAVCVKTRTPVYITNVPWEVQFKYDLPETLDRAWFEPGGPNDQTDFILANDELIPLEHFVDNDVRITPLAFVEAKAPARDRHLVTA